MNIQNVKIHFHRNFYVVLLFLRLSIKTCWIHRDYVCVMCVLIFTCKHACTHIFQKRASFFLYKRLHTHLIKFGNTEGNQHYKVYYQLYLETGCLINSFFSPCDTRIKHFHFLTSCSLTFFILLPVEQQYIEFYLLLDFWQN